MIKLVVFDFDGTLADTKKLLLKIIEHNVEKFDIKLNNGFLKSFGDKILDETLSVLGVEEHVFPSLAREIEFDFIKHSYLAPLCSGIMNLKKINKKKIILSNSIDEFIKEVLKKNKITFFDEVYGCDRFENKREGFREIIKKYKVKPEEIVYVGDRPVDTALAKFVGCYSVILTHKASWSSKKDIENSKPDYIATSLNDLRKVINHIDHIT